MIKKNSYYLKKIKNGKVIYNILLIADSPPPKKNKTQTINVKPLIRSIKSEINQICEIGVYGIYGIFSFNLR